MALTPKQQETLDKVRAKLWTQITDQVKCSPHLQRVLGLGIKEDGKQNGTHS